jgi:hypothetical protein
MDRYVEATLKAHAYLVGSHWRDGALVGPDSGIRFNYRLGRFVKGYLGHLRWRDSYAYIQAQGYWILSNWILYHATGEQRFRELALACSRYVMSAQREDGAWEYPNPEWKGRIATVEGTWGSLGLLESYRNTGDGAFLDPVRKWHRFLVTRIGFQEAGDEMAVNYFADRVGPRVPNNSSDVLRFLAEFAEATNDEGVLAPVQRGLVSFMRNVQKATGEYPYAVPGVAPGKTREHFQCFQYNAFQCIGLARYYELTGDKAIVPAIERVARFLGTGLAPDGHLWYSCHDERREVVYHAAAAVAAFACASRLDIANCEVAAERAYAYVASKQRDDGSFPFSAREHFVLRDDRAYPRNIAMIQYHLLLRGAPGLPTGIEMGANKPGATDN